MMFVEQQRRVPSDGSFVPYAFQPHEQQDISGEHFREQLQSAMGALHEENDRIRGELADARALMLQRDMEIAETANLRAKLETERLCVQRARLAAKSQRTLAQLVTSICSQNLRKLAERYESGFGALMNEKEEEVMAARRRAADLELQVRMRGQETEQMIRRRVIAPPEGQRPFQVPMPPPTQLQDIFTTIMGAHTARSLQRPI